MPFPNPGNPGMTGGDVIVMHGLTHRVTHGVMRGRPRLGRLARIGAPVVAAVEAAHGLDEVGPEWDAVFAAGPGFQSSRAWFGAVAAAALPAGSRALFWLVRDGFVQGGGRPLLLLPMLEGPGRRLSGLTTPYTTLFQPLPAAGLDGAGLHRAGEALGRQLRTWATTAGTAAMDCLDPDWPGLPPLLAGLRAGGMAARGFDHFGNWHQPIRDWEGYLAARPGPLRETIRRKSRACARDPSVVIETIHGGAAPGAVAAALAAYEEVYARSWKQPEPSPGFNAALLPRAAMAGVLRMGVMRAGGQPVAAQYWTVADGVATVLKLAHDDAWRALSPGTVLTAHMIRGLVMEGVTGLDFGRGDDPYKRLWAGQRRQRTGVLLADPWRASGAAALVRHDMGTILRRLRADATAIKL